MIKDLVKAKDKVESLLKSYPECRDNDKLLWLAYLVVFHDLREILGEEAYVKFRELLLNEDTVTMESIRRVRQKFQEEGKYVGTKRKHRLKEETEVRDFFR